MKNSNNTNPNFPIYLNDISEEDYEKILTEIFGRATTYTHINLRYLKFQCNKFYDDNYLAFENDKGMDGIVAIFSSLDTQPYRKNRWNPKKVFGIYRIRYSAKTGWLITQIEKIKGWGDTDYMRYSDEQRAKINAFRDSGKALRRKKKIAKAA